MQINRAAGMLVLWVAGGRVHLSLNPLGTTHRPDVPPFGGYAALVS